MFRQVADWSVAMLFLRPVTRHHKALFAIAAIVLSASSAHAQTRAVLLGSVRSDSTGLPLVNAEVYIPSLGINSRTDSVGRFRMENIKPGEYDVIIRRFGFTPSVLRMKFEADETTAHQFELTLSPTVLAKVKVLAPDTSRSLYVDNITRFEERRALGFGSFIGERELRAAADRNLSSVLHTIPDLRFVRSNGAVVAVSAAHGRRCPLQLFLDGMKVSAAFDINSIGPASLRGIEFYSTTTTAPSEFTASPGYCGVLVLWTAVTRN